MGLATSSLQPVRCPRNDYRKMLCLHLKRMAKKSNRPCPKCGAEIARRLPVDERPGGKGRGLTRVRRAEVYTKKAVARLATRGGEKGNRNDEADGDNESRRLRGEKEVVLEKPVRALRIDHLSHNVTRRCEEDCVEVRRKRREVQGLLLLLLRQATRGRTGRLCKRSYEAEEGKDEYAAIAATWSRKARNWISRSNSW